MDGHLSGRQESGLCVDGHLGGQQESGLCVDSYLGGRQESGMCGWSSRLSAGIRRVRVVILVGGRNQACVGGHLGRQQE